MELRDISTLGGSKNFSFWAEDRHRPLNAFLHRISGHTGLLLEGINMNGLIEQRAAKYGRMTQIMAQRELTPQEAAEFDALAAQVDAIDKRLAGVETYVGYDAASEDPGAMAPVVDPTMAGTAGRGLALAHASRRRTMPGAIGGNLVGAYGQRHRPGDSDSLRAWLRCGTPLEQPQDRGLLYQAGHSGNSSALEFRGLATTPDSAGGFTVATSVYNQVSRTLKNYSPVRSLAQVLTTTNGEPLRVPRCDDTANSGAIVSEGSAHAEQDAVFSTVTMGAFTYSSKMVRVSNELLADSQIDLARFLGEILGERLGRIQANHFLLGNGSTEPQGVITGASTVAAASATAITCDDLINVAAAVDPAYLADIESVGWVMHPTIFSLIRKLKDSYGAYIVQPITDAGPPNLLGYPVRFASEMDSTTAATKKTVLFGNFKQYLIRDAGTLVVARSNERYFEYNQSAFIALYRTDAKLLQAGAFRTLLH